MGFRRAIVPIGTDVVPADTQMEVMQVADVVGGSSAGASGAGDGTGQKTRVGGVWRASGAWGVGWPTAAAVAGARPADAVRQWGRLGYPRRALRLHACAEVIATRHGGRVPDSLGELRALPGVGAYTAAAVASLAFGQRHAVLDTNVRRVLARPGGGRELA